MAARPPIFDSFCLVELSKNGGGAAARGCRKRGLTVEDDCMDAVGYPDVPEYIIKLWCQAFKILKILSVLLNNYVSFF